MPRSGNKVFRFLRSVLEIPAAYNLWWRMVGGSALVNVMVTEFLKGGGGTRILEIGCGPGTILGYLPDCEYVGFDVSSHYIEMARRRFPGAQFFCTRVSEFSLAKLNRFDTVLALGIVHHLDDQEAMQLFQIAYDALKPGGKLVTFDGVWTDDKYTFARWLLARDRGEHIRTRPEDLEIASQVFSNVKPRIRHDLLRIPYTHLILECIR